MKVCQMSNPLKYAQSILYKQTSMQLHGKNIFEVAKTVHSTNQNDVLLELFCHHLVGH